MWPSSVAHRRSSCSRLQVEGAGTAASYPFSTAHLHTCFRQTNLRRRPGGPLPVRASTDVNEQPCNRSTKPKWLGRLASALSGSGGVSLLAAALPLTLSGDGGGIVGNGGGEGGGGGGDGNGHSNVDLVCDVAAVSEDDDDDEESDLEVEEDDVVGDVDPADREGEEDVDAPKADNFFCAEVVSEGLPVGKGIPTEEELFAGLNCQPGFECTREELAEDLRALFQTGLFEDVDARVEAIPGKKHKSRVEFSFTEKVWPAMRSFAVKGSTILPEDVPEKVMEGLKPGPSTVETLAKMRNLVEGWYQDRGFVFSYIRDFDGMEDGNVVANVVEGRVNNVSVVYLDDQGNPSTKPPQIDPAIVLRETPFKQGDLYNSEDGRRALRDVFGLQLFDNVQVVPKQTPKDERLIDVEVMVKERPMRTVDVECEWGIAPGDSGRPGLVSIVPGGQITFEDRNFAGQCRSLSASINAQNLLAPADDLSFRMEYRHPYLWGDDDPQKTALGVSVFNSRKLSGVFSSPSGDDVPSVWVDRSGGKASITETYSRNSKGSLGLVLEQVATRDESGALCTHGLRQTGMGTYAADGPPTTLSDTGVDRLLFLQGQLTRDATYYVNGAQVGSRDIYTAEQSLLGSAWPLFNRFTVSLTRFLQLRESKDSKAPPPVLVLHGRYGTSFGDMASYDYFMLGGPYSVRGYNVGELAACRSFLEYAAELRMMAPLINKQVYAFYEHGSDMGSSKECRGNPTLYYRRPGSGSSWGAGMKLGAIRAEFVVDGNAGQGSWFLRFGERF